jgi:hypothetical protein
MSTTLAGAPVSPGRAAAVVVTMPAPVAAPPEATVTQSETAQLLREAQTHADTGDYIAAMAGLSLAFEALLDHYSGSRSFDGWWQSPFSFGPELGHDRRVPRSAVF